MNRREFLGTLGVVVPVGLMARPQHASGRHVIVMGAGLAGLAAGFRLRDAGWKVSILEARTRPGGRVLTMREPFPDGLYAEAGAARIQDSHEYTLRYVKQFNLTLDPFWPTEGRRVARVAGRRIVTRHGSALDLAQIPFDFSEEERKMGFRGALVKYLFSPVNELGDRRPRTGLRAT